MDITSSTDAIDSKRRVTGFNQKLLNYIKNNEDQKAISLLNKDMCNLVDGYGSLLHYAASFGNERITRHLIKLGANVDIKAYNGVTPLMIAIEKMNLNVIEFLLEANPDVDITNHLGISALQMVLDQTYSNFCVVAIMMNYLRRKISSLEKFIEKIVEAGCSLFDAVYLNDIEVIRSLIKHGLDVNSEGRNYSLRALHNAAGSGEIEMVEFLIENGADICALTEDEKDPLYYAVICGHHNVVKSLLSRGANPNFIIGSYDRFPRIFCAVIKADYLEKEKLIRLTTRSNYAQKVDKCIELLLQKGANPQILTLEKSTIFHVTQYLDKRCNESYDKNVNNIASIHLVIANLAMLKMLGTPISKPIRYGLNLNVQYKEYYKLCLRMLKAKIYKSMTLFELLTESDAKLKIYMRNKKCVYKLMRISRKQELAVFYPYYFNTIEKRISEITKEMGLEYFAVKAIVTISKCNMPYTIAEEIIGYLDQQSQEKLITLIEVD